MDFFWVKSCYWRNFQAVFLPISFILNDIEESAIRLSDFYIFRVQRWLNRFVYITTNHSCCPLNCPSVPAKSPICRSPNTFPLAPHPPAPQQVPLANCKVFFCQYLWFSVILKNPQTDFHIFTFSECKDDWTGLFTSQPITVVALSTAPACQQRAPSAGAPRLFLFL